VIRRCHGAVFHNASLAAEQNAMTRRSAVLSIYSMTDRAAIGDAAAAGERPRPLVVAACSYAFDEPVDLILATAARLPQIDFALTGPAPAAVRRDAPENVHFTGWLADSDYHDTIVRASAVICLTTRDATMQNGIIEALEHRRPVITSNTQTLRDWAQDVPGVLTVEHDPAALAVSIRAVVDDRRRWLNDAEQGQRVAIRRASAELCQLREALAAGGR
jgi:glycosyltransferase involved in cell wall biosynthesis